MRKKLVSVALVLVMCLELLPRTAFAVQTGGLSVSFETAIFSISKETFVRTPPEPASQAECGKDEYLTVRALVSKPEGMAVTLRKIRFRIDGGEELRWAKDVTMKAGEPAEFHVYHSNQRYLTPGLHTVELYASGKLLASGHFSIGRDWSKIFKFPTEEQSAGRSDDERAPYMTAWLSTGQNIRFNAYCVDFKSDYLPYGTYSCLFNGYMDYSSLKEQYETVKTDGISLYGGLQQGAEGKPSNSILTMWDIYCTDKDGTVTTIRPVRTYTAEETDTDRLVGNLEGQGSQTLLPYEWKAGRWYRMLLRCATSKTTGNTTVEQWFQDLTTNKWTHMCTYDTGVKNSSFIGNVALFSENFLKQYAGEVRSLEFTNVRIHTGKVWRDVVSTPGGIFLHETGFHTNAYGSWEAGADRNTFYMITTGVPGWGRTERTGALSIRNRESGNPLSKQLSTAA